MISIYTYATFMPPLTLMFKVNTKQLTKRVIRGEWWCCGIITEGRDIRWGCGKTLLKWWRILQGLNQAISGCWTLFCPFSISHLGQRKTSSWSYDMGPLRTNLAADTWPVSYSLRTVKRRDPTTNDLSTYEKRCSILSLDNNTNQAGRIIDAEA